MKILLLYTPRSGSTSILKYFQKLKPNYECFNEPWFEWMVKNVHKNEIQYLDLISKNNIFVKSAYKTLPVSLETIVKDFDKIIILLRKNHKEQVESSILTHKEQNFLNHKPRKYNIYNINNSEFEEASDRYMFLNETIGNFALKNNLPIFYYEDLYYGDFTPLFNELNIEYDMEQYDAYLNVSNKYRIGDVSNKTINTLL
jgi:hypothetical protein